MFKRDRQRARFSLDIPCITTKCIAALIKRAPKKMIRAAYTRLWGFRTRTRIALTSKSDITEPHAVQRDPRSSSTPNRYCRIDFGESSDGMNGSRVLFHWLWNVLRRSLAFSCFASDRFYFTSTGASFSGPSQEIHDPHHQRTVIVKPDKVPGWHEGDLGHLPSLQVPSHISAAIRFCKPKPGDPRSPSTANRCCQTGRGPRLV
jgi:hypothetical protein